MKQQIDQKQFSELTESGKNKLSEWVRETQSQAYLGVEWRREFELSIGQMIFFLGEDYKYVVITYFGDQESSITEVVLPKNLCDALWEAVKSILENQTALAASSRS